MARNKNYSDTMIRAMLSALTHQGSDGRYQLLTRGRTLWALDARGAVESEEISDNHGRPVTLWYLTPAAVRNLRNSLVLMMGGSTSNATKMHREFVRSGWREAEAAARLILGDFEGAKLVTTTRHERGSHTEHLSAADTVSRLANILSNGQPVHEHGTGIDGDEPAERLSAHLGGAVGAVTDFYIKRPAAVDPVKAAEARAAELVPNEGNYLATKEERGGRYVSHGIMQRTAVIAMLTSAFVMGAEVGADGGTVTITYDAETRVTVRRTFNDGDEVTVHPGTPNEFVGKILRPARSGCFRIQEPQHGTACDYPAVELGPVEEDDRADAAAVEREAAELLGDGEQWMRHFRRFGETPRVERVDRAAAVELIVWARRHGGWQVYRADEGGVSLESPTGESSYWLHRPAPKGERVPVCDLNPGDEFVTRCGWTVLASDGWTFTAVSSEGQTVTQSVSEGTQVLRTRRASSAVEGDVFAG